MPPFGSGDIIMPVYTVLTGRDEVTPAQRSEIAREITRINTTLTGAPRSFVRIVFSILTPGRTLTAGEPAPLALLHGSIRAGRTRETKIRLLGEISAMFMRLTGVAPRDLVVSISDIAAQDVMEGGKILPEPQQEAEWLARYGYRD
jgi:phenylpyruvate tautomerase PptA (4-oxalocrotonate tautomerase family)